MSCSRCGGLLIPESANDPGQSFLDARHPITLQRCVSCGDRTDATILRHRAQQADARRLVAEAEQLVAVCGGPSLRLLQEVSDGAA
jgi:hypothetical protein